MRGAYHRKVHLSLCEIMRGAYHREISLTIKGNQSIYCINTTNNVNYHHINATCFYYNYLFSSFFCSSIANGGLDLSV
jgi:hypothetical protein